jgi:hypothetical protein
LDSAESQADAPLAAEPLAAEPAPTLEQRLSPWLTIRTTVKEQGLVIQVARPFRERVSAVGFDRLLLEPAEVSFVRTDRLWLAAALGAAGVVLSWPGILELPGIAGLTGLLARSLALSFFSALLGPGLLAAAILVLLLAAADPRRLSVFLDREQGLHPKVVRGGEDEPQAAAFVEQVKQAIVTGEAGDGTEDEAVAQASLADTLDALLAMRQNGLLDDQELRLFQEFAERR